MQAQGPDAVLNQGKTGLKRFKWATLGGTLQAWEVLAGVSPHCPHGTSHKAASTGFPPLFCSPTSSLLPLRITSTIEYTHLNPCVGSFWGNKDRIGFPKHITHHLLSQTKNMKYDLPLLNPTMSKNLWFSNHDYQWLSFAMQFRSY